ncbi:MAG TPA: phage portal protein, partial [Bacillota bacterium]|nr:phage portal protein [Bacillota bacterium]
MGFLSSVFHSRDKPKNYLSSSFYSFFFGGTSSGKLVNETTAMQMTAV